MTNTLNLLLLVGASMSVAIGYWGPDLPPGPYCGKRGTRQCCNDRQDSCSHEILSTLCYCDQFCNRSRVHDDCCPDYEEVCLGISPPPNPITKPCRYNNKFYPPGEKVKQGCNECECVIQSDRPEEVQWSCEQDVCLISEDVINGVNYGNEKWRAANYSEFYGKKLKDGIKYKLGTFPLTVETKRMGSIRYDKNIVYPNEFDCRTKWRDYISPVIDQGWCGSDWAVTIATVVSDRFAIQSNGMEKILLSPQTLLSCNRRYQRGCDGGHIDAAWNYVREDGLLDDNCFPYEAKVTKCPVKPKSDNLPIFCTPSVPERTTRYKVGPPGKLKKELDIMYDIMESGPVHAVMTVYQDFFHYRDGVYRHTRYGDNQLQGLHSVRIVGWGENRGDKYWIVANSWGREWGIDGYFHIARGENESGIESFVVTVLSDVINAKK
ncbi:uncharacterized peptidase C1-like protein F26E4.3 isoform X1 [Galleria mellonella]|uniref:Uncharacterized peptidase C1-like protein F26E4.3 isoform X1 n=2 Tax=Galleria mellonella TaxID=7137 RepID=A0A6J1WBL3_GALME|nr:uncharacterized peptidase C1-like protein F26E4.3 isoform X1 [Galleria mellonella]